MNVKVIIKKVEEYLKIFCVGVLIILFLIGMAIPAIKSYNQKILKPILKEQEINSSLIKYYNNVISSNSYKIIKPVKAKIVCKGYYSNINPNEISFFLLKKLCLEQIPEANELIDVEINYTTTTIYGITKVVAEMSATAIKYN